MSEEKQHGKFEVIKYFDDHYDGVVKNNLTFEEAKELADKLNNSIRAYVAYSMRPQRNDKNN